MKRVVYSSLLIIVSLVGSVYGGTYGGGTGDANDPYLVYEAIHMQEIGDNPNDWDKHFKMMRDVDMIDYNESNFNIIGTDDVNYFSGVFEGDGYKIINFSYASTGINYIGLFGYAVGAEISNLFLKDSNINAGTGNTVGSLIGYNVNGTITNCFVTGNVTGTSGASDIYGGLIGSNDEGTISNCYVIGDISGDDNVGGLVGNNWGTISNCYTNCNISGDHRLGGLVGMNYGTISICYTSGTIVATSHRIGGLVGWNRAEEGYGIISNCYSNASVWGNWEVGGLIGLNSSSTEISYCYSTGSVLGNVFVGGLIGLNWGIVNSSFWDIETSNQIFSDGGTGKTTLEMRMESTYTAEGWDFATPVWMINDLTDYPKLTWISYGGGRGIEECPYLIYTPLQMNAIGANPADWDNHFKLMADIDMSGYKETEYNLIGRDGTNYFSGVFDGNGHTISNFSYSGTGVDFYVGYFGLFGFVVNAEIKNLGLIDCNLVSNAGHYVGGLVGGHWHGTIINCYVTGSVLGTNRAGWIGGLVGKNSTGTIIDCYTICTVTGEDHVGGLVGQNSGTVTKCYSISSVGDDSTDDRTGGLVGKNFGIISYSYSSGSVVGNHWRVGGLVGWNVSYGGQNLITNCYSDCYVSANAEVGGLVGNNYGGEISNCYSVGAVEGDTDVGGLVGSNTGGGIEDSFWDVNTSGMDTSDGGTGATTVQMRESNTFISVGWDFLGETMNGTDDIWRLCVDGEDYPRFAWESVPPDFACPNGVNFADFAYFAGHWGDTDCSASNDCNRTDLDYSTVIDINDLKLFTDNWLTGF